MWTFIDRHRQKETHNDEERLNPHSPNLENV